MMSTKESPYKIHTHEMVDFLEGFRNVFLERDQGSSFFVDGRPTICAISMNSLSDPRTTPLDHQALQGGSWDRSNNMILQKIDSISFSLESKAKSVMQMGSRVWVSRLTWICLFLWERSVGLVLKGNLKEPSMFKVPKLWDTPTCAGITTSPLA